LIGVRWKKEERKEGKRRQLRERRGRRRSRGRTEDCGVELGPNLKYLGENGGRDCDPFVSFSLAHLPSDVRYEEKPSAAPFLLLLLPLRGAGFPLGLNPGTSAHPPCTRQMITYPRRVGGGGGGRSNLPTTSITRPNPSMPTHTRIHITPPPRGICSPIQQRPFPIEHEKNNS
jgi:hypothetical protein